MRKLAAGVASLAIALLTTAAGIMLDAKALIYGGMLLGALALILWLSAWSRHGTQAPQPHSPVHTSPPPPRKPIINVDPDFVTMLVILAGIPVGLASIFLVMAALFRLIGMVTGAGS